MNYSVTLSAKSKSKPAPITRDCSNFLNTEDAKCYCDVNKAPYTYFEDDDQLSQTLMVLDVNSTLIQVISTYHSGVCFQVLNALYLSNSTGSPGAGSNNCFPPSTTILDTTGQAYKKSISLTTSVFERYPAQYKYLSTPGVTLLWTSLSLPRRSLSTTESMAASRAHTSTTPLCLFHQAVVASPFLQALYTLSTATSPLTIYPYIYEIVFTGWIFNCKDCVVCS